MTFYVWKDGNKRHFMWKDGNKKHFMWKDESKNILCMERWK